MFRAPARVGLVASSIAAFAALLLPSSAFASTTIGSAQGNTLCQNAPFDAVQLKSVGSSYAVPAGGGSITSWSFQPSSVDSGFAALEVWRATAPPTYALVGISPSVTLRPTPTNPIVLAAPIPVLAGDLIGLRLEGVMNCDFLTSNPSDTLGYEFGPVPAVMGTRVMLTVGGFHLNVAATVEVTAPLAPPPPTTCAAQCQFSGEQQVTDCQGTPPQNQGNCVDATGTHSRNQGSSVTKAPPRGRQGNHGK